MAEVETMCNYIIFLHKGKIYASGSPTEITNKILTREKDEPSLEEVFIKIAKQYSL
jgi:ABC-type multidrug transport system ATPase subunit